MRLPGCRQRRSPPVVAAARLLAPLPPCPLFPPLWSSVAVAAADLSAVETGVAPPRLSWQRHYLPLHHPVGSGGPPPRRVIADASSRRRSSAVCHPTSTSPRGLSAVASGGRRGLAAPPPSRSWSLSAVGAPQRLPSLVPSALSPSPHPASWRTFPEPFVSLPPPLTTGTHRAPASSPPPSMTPPRHCRPAPVVKPSPPSVPFFPSVSPPFRRCFRRLAGRRAPPPSPATGACSFLRRLPGSLPPYRQWRTVCRCCRLFRRGSLQSCRVVVAPLSWTEPMRGGACPPPPSCRRIQSPGAATTASMRRPPPSRRAAAPVVPVVAASWRSLAQRCLSRLFVADRSPLATTPCGVPPFPLYPRHPV